MIHQKVPPTPSLGENTILTIAVRNLLTNAIKFSNQQGNNYIDVLKENDVVIHSIRDEGIGMSPEQLEQIHSNHPESTTGTTGEKGSGLGIFLVKELLSKIGGKLMINSEPAVRIQLPVV